MESTIAMDASEVDAMLAAPASEPTVRLEEGPSELGLLLGAAEPTPSMAKTVRVAPGAGVSALLSDEPMASPDATIDWGADDLVDEHHRQLGRAGVHDSARAGGGFAIKLE